MAGFWPCPVVLTSPQPVSECIRRLSAMTTRRGVIGWYADVRHVGRPYPRLRGEVLPSRVLVAVFDISSYRNRFAPWLEARLEPSAGGGTALTGEIGLHPWVSALRPLAYGVWAVVAVAGVVAGVAGLAAGHLSSLAFALIPLAVIAGMVAVDAARMRSLEWRVPRLIQEINEVLGSTAAFTGPAGAAGDDGNSP